MDDAARRALFVEWFNGPPMRGDRKRFMEKTGYSKGRLTQLLDSGQQFGERAAKEVATRLGLPSDAFTERRLSAQLMERPASYGSKVTHHFSHPALAPLVAHDLSQAKATVVLQRIVWEDLVNTELPDLFELEVIDDALSPVIPCGRIARFSRSAAPVPGQTPVLLKDRDGNHYIRHYRVLRPGHWKAVALDAGYDDLDSVEHGLEVVATMKGFDWF